MSQFCVHRPMFYGKNYAVEAPILKDGEGFRRLLAASDPVHNAQNIEDLWCAAQCS